MANAVTPQLEAPGAGLPFLDSLLMRFYVGPVLSKKGSVRDNWDRFTRTNDKISALVKDIPLEKTHQKVLVPKLKGIEDSSRYWSIAETLEHLEIVGNSINQLINSLLRNEVPATVANVADYKPKGKYNGQDARPAFAAFSKRISEALRDREISLQTPKYRHPWLGPITAQQWQWVLASHSGLHYVQVKEIIKGLSK